MVACGVCFSQPCICCVAYTWLTVCPRIFPPGRWGGVRLGEGGRQMVRCFRASSFSARLRRSPLLVSATPSRPTAAPAGPGLARAEHVTRQCRGLACLACQGGSGSGSWTGHKEQKRSPEPLRGALASECGGKGRRQLDFCVPRAGARGPSRERPAQAHLPLPSWRCGCPQPRPSSQGGELAWTPPVPALPCPSPLFRRISPRNLISSCTLGLPLRLSS